MTELRCGVRARVFPLLCAVALLVPDLIAARVTSGAIDVLHYDVEVKPDFDQRTITGTDDDPFPKSRVLVERSVLFP